jgi:ABC-2 type transport system permease protein
MRRFIRNVKAITGRELSGYFGSPVAYVFIVIFLLLCGFFTFSVSRFYELGEADLRAFFEWHPWIFLFLVPSVGMRLWAEERRTGSIELILTLPITLSEAIVGKFLAAWLFIGMGLFLTFPLVLTVMYLGDPDLGVVSCAYIGSFLMAGAYLSVASMTSSFTRNQVVSFILSVMICLFLVLAGWPPVTGALSTWAPLWLIDVISGFGFMPHFASMERGVLDLRDLFYFFSVIFFMLFTNGVVLQNRKTS